ncbi:hypothetical protein Q5P01_011541 [Channa striata]|uniref:Uncharacterized protein n=1 Tax=Channa striata TaxID=64152 RepID=A0AA88MXP1_CHASR|nr:hypothetical protein Q5P01_011541 [Channa striata]
MHFECKSTAQRSHQDSSRGISMFMFTSGLWRHKPGDNRERFVLFGSLHLPHYIAEGNTLLLIPLTLQLVKGAFKNHQVFHKFWEMPVMNEHGGVFQCQLAEEA